jgi:hypothetical protein
VPLLIEIGQIAAGQRVLAAAKPIRAVVHND